jgi:hypothetical protein
MQMADSKCSDYTESNEKMSARVRAKQRIWKLNQDWRKIVDRSAAINPDGAVPPIPADHVRGVHPQNIHLKPGPVRPTKED